LVKKQEQKSTWRLPQKNNRQVHTRPERMW